MLPATRGDRMMKGDRLRRALSALSRNVLAEVAEGLELAWATPAEHSGRGRNASRRLVSIAALPAPAKRTSTRRATERRLTHGRACRFDLVGASTVRLLSFGRDPAGPRD